MQVWASITMLQACAANCPAREIAAFARDVQPQDDSEGNAAFAAHRCFCGQIEAAVRLPRFAIQGTCCSYSMLETDLLFANVRSKSEDAAIRRDGSASRDKFLSERKERRLSSPCAHG